MISPSQLVLVTFFCTIFAQGFALNEDTYEEPPSIASSDLGIELVPGVSKIAIVRGDLNVTGTLAIGTCVDVLEQLTLMQNSLSLQNQTITALQQELSVSRATATALESKLEDQLAAQALNTSTEVASLMSDIENVQGEISELGNNMLKSSEDADKELLTKFDDLQDEIDTRFDRLNTTYGFDTAGRCSAIDCGTNNHLVAGSKKILCESHECEHDECCATNPTCKTHTCARGYTTNTDVTSKQCAQGPACKETECCTTNPKCTKDFTCETGYNRRLDYTTLCASPKCGRDDCCDEIKDVIFSWKVDWQFIPSGYACWDYGRSPWGIAFSTTDRLGRKVSDHRLPQVGEQVTFKVIGQAGTALNKVKTITGRVERLVMPNSNGGFLSHTDRKQAFQFIGEDIRTKMTKASVHFDQLYYSSSTVRNGRSNEVWFIEFKLTAK